MLLNLEKAGVSMKIIYKLSEELMRDPERVVLAQALTMNPAKPMLGLKGECGLFGSVDWWRSIDEGKMPLLHLEGIVQRVYAAGQDAEENNTIDLLMEDGSIVEVGIYTNDEKDVELIRIGCRVGVVYALDKLKRQPAPSGGVNYSKIALEMAVALRPVT